MPTKFRIMVFLIVAIVTIPSPIKAINPRKLDETTNPVGSPNDEVKCGSCPCGTTCYSSPPPPIPIPSPPPPTPSPPPPSPPPPKKPSSPKCPPPPHGGGESGGGGGGGSGSGGGGGGSSGQTPIYVSGPPGDLYPVVQSISAAYNKRFAVTPASMMVFGLMGMLAFW